ncbi:MAG: hypothetical protein NVSMB26_07700 [Beijerinckiaceae bacterium]
MRATITVKPGGQRLKALDDGFLGQIALEATAAGQGQIAIEETWHGVPEMWAQRLYRVMLRVRKQNAAAHTLARLEPPQVSAV